MSMFSNGGYTDMVCSIRDIPVYYEEYGKGIPVLCIHGWPVDHRMVADMLEPVFNEMQSYRRIYIDLPGMGQTPSAQWIKSSDNMLEVVVEFIHAVIGEQSFLLVGGSYGGYLALGLIHEMSHKIDGVFLLYPDTGPRGNEAENLPPRTIIQQSKEADYTIAEYYKEMAVIFSQKNYDNWQKVIQPALDCADMNFLTNHCSYLFTQGLQEGIDVVTFGKPSCILAGRQDHTTGYKLAYELVERFPRATFSILDCAGHRLEVEREWLFRQLLRDWIDRVAQYS